MRRVLAVVLAVLVAVLVPAVAIGHWAEQAVVDPDGVASIADKVLSDPAVVDGMATWLTDEIFGAVAPVVAGEVPRWLRPFVRSAGDAARTTLHDAISSALSSEQGRAVMVDAVLVAHASALRVLAGNGLFPSGAVTVGDGAVTVNLVPVAVLALSALGDGSPGLDVGLVHTAAQLGRLVGVELPDGFGQLTVYRNDAIAPHASLRAARDLLVTLQRLKWEFTVALLVALPALVVVAVERRLAVVRAGIGVVLVSGAAGVWLQLAGGDVGGAVKSTSGRVAVDAVRSALLSGATWTLVATAAIAVAVSLVCWITLRIGRSGTPES